MEKKGIKVFDCVLIQVFKIKRLKGKLVGIVPFLKSRSPNNLEIVKRKSECHKIIVDVVVDRLMAW